MKRWLALLLITSCSPAQTPVGDSRREEPRPAPVEAPRVASDEPSVEQLERRHRSFARLHEEGVPYIAHLPVVEREAELRFRTRDEIVDRAVALFVVASRGARDPADYVAEMEARYDATRLYTPVERAYMSGPAETAQGTALSWRFEALRVLLWALGYIDDLPKPIAPMDGVEIARVVRPRTVEDLREGAQLRSHAAILDAADLIYRYAWACVDARIQGRPAPAGLDTDVVIEWHHAINWLIALDDAEWDYVRTDT
ncbi:MAG: DUF4272 domain-containing protein [Sandaracinaceae bacterium]|nr:MAG: DUF4272 domain-containing protein [Sandaracinaceae bacterium]